MPQDILKNLNPQQKKAVTHDQGPLLIIAGAGTGKTTVITHKIAYLINNRKVRPDHILALTFTDKASFQMREKVDVLVPYGFTDTWIHTFHAFGDRVLRDNALELGLNPDFKVLTRPQTAVFFKENLFKFPLNYYRPLSTPTKFIEAMISLFSRLRDEDVSVEEYLAYAEKLKQESARNLDDEALQETAQRHHELAKCYAQYQALLLQESKVDFASQFYLVLKLFREHPSVLKQYQEQFRFILVDEFQDTNYAQLELVKLLAQKSKNLTVVADDDQSIYKWRGAAVSNILNFMKTYPKSEKIALTKNYRSTQPILDCAYQVIQNNNPDRFEVQAGIKKRLIGLTPKGKKVKHVHFDSLSHEADWIAEYIKDKVKTKKYSYADFAILVRANKNADPFMRALNMCGIPWQFSGNQGLYSREEVRLCISFLRLVANPADSLSLYFLASSTIYNVPSVELTLVMNFAHRRQWDLFYTLKNLENNPDLKEKSPEFLSAKDKLIEDIERFIECSRTMTTGRLLYLFLTETGFLKDLVSKKTPEDEDKIKNIALFFDLVKEFEYVANEDRVLYFINYLDMLISAGDDPPTAEASMDVAAVNILTIHKAKGLEFPVVFLVNLIEGNFPCPSRKEPIELPDDLIKDILPIGDFHMQEERRLFYVGMTRAQKELYLTSAVDYGTKRPKKASRFVTEAVVEKRDTSMVKTSALEAIERHAPRSESFRDNVEKIADDKILNLSYYQIDDYSTCPLKYKYVHILRVPILTHHTVLYGKALHDAVQHYHARKIKGLPVKEDELLNIFDESFRKEGFLSREHIDLRMKTGYKALRNFYRDQEASRIIPTYVEKDFSFTIGLNRVVGRWDRIDVIDDKVKIIDFKSSKIEKKEQADKKAKESLQLSLYGLAYKEIYGVLPDFKELHFLETGLVGRSTMTDKDVDKVIHAIEATSEGIRGARFDAKPSPFSCLYCAFNQICPFARLSRQ